MPLLRPALLAAALALASLPALAADPVMLQIGIKDHRFAPAELHAPARTPIVLTVTNQDATPEEFDSHDLKVEKVVPGGHAAVIHLRGLAPGRYGFVGEYHEATAKGVLVIDPGK